MKCIASLTLPEICRIAEEIGGTHVDGHGAAVVFTPTSVQRRRQVGLLCQKGKDQDHAKVYLWIVRLEVERPF